MKRVMWVENVNEDAREFLVWTRVGKSALPNRKRQPVYLRRLEKRSL